jgi:kumamolisin
MGRGGCRGRAASAAVLVAVVAALALLLPGLPSTPLSRDTLGGTAAAALSPASTLPFPERAGYDPANASLASDLRPATAPMTISLTFEPRGPVEPSRSAAGLTSAGFRAQYGVAPSILSAAEQYFEADGLAVASAGADGLSLNLAGSPVAVGEAFGTSLLAGTYDGRPVLFPDSPPSLPSWLEPSVAGVVGLEAGFQTFSFSLSSAEGAASAGASSPQLGPVPISPADARTAYNLSGLYNLTATPTFPTSESIAVILWGAGYAPSDIGTFLNQDYPSSFPRPKIVGEPVGGAPQPGASALTAPDQDAVEELSLDIEWSLSMAPGATIYAVYAPNGPASENYSPSTSNLTLALEEALSLDVSVISMSFGSPESASGAMRSTWEPLLSEARSRGITVLAATGDLGGDAAASCEGGPSVDYPATSPNVTAVGGTNLTYTSNPLGPPSISESAWSLSTGGFSTLVGAPSWQEVGSAKDPIEASGHRGVPDVAATASDNFVYYNGSDTAASGTSFATPLWAGLVASMDAVNGSRLGWINARLYHIGANEPGGQVGDGLVLITSGGNCVGSATTGWDDVTGWGSPRAVLLYEDFEGSFVDLALSIAPTTVAPGGTIVVHAELENLNGTPLPGTTVNVTLRATTSIGPCTGLFDSGSPTTNGTGGIGLILRVPYCYLGSHAVVNVSVVTVKLYGAVQGRLAVNLLGLVPGLEVLETPPWNYVTFVGIVGVAIAAGGLLGRGPPLVATRRPPGPPRGPPPAAAAPPPASAAPPAVASRGPSPASPGSSPAPPPPASPPVAPPSAPPSTPAP